MHAQVTLSFDWLAFAVKLCFVGSRKQKIGVPNWFVWFGKAVPANYTHMVQLGWHLRYQFHLFIYLISQYLDLPYLCQEQATTNI